MGSFLLTKEYTAPNTSGVTFTGQSEPPTTKALASNSARFGAIWLARSRGSTVAIASGMTPGKHRLGDISAVTPVYANRAMSSSATN